jgi:hypothetical protein
MGSGKENNALFLSCLSCAAAIGRWWRAGGAGGCKQVAGKDVTDKGKPSTFFEGIERKNKAENSIHRHGFADNLCRTLLPPGIIWIRPKISIYDGIRNVSAEDGIS